MAAFPIMDDTFLLDGSELYLKLKEAGIKVHPMVAGPLIGAALGAPLGAAAGNARSRFYTAKTRKHNTRAGAIQGAVAGTAMGALSGMSIHADKMSKAMHARRMLRLGAEMEGNMKSIARLEKALHSTPFSKKAPVVHSEARAAAKKIQDAGGTSKGPVKRTWKLKPLDDEEPIAVKKSIRKLAASRTRLLKLALMESSGPSTPQIPTPGSSRLGMSGAGGAMGGFSPTKPQAPKMSMGNQNASATKVAMHPAAPYAMAATLGGASTGLAQVRRMHGKPQDAPLMELAEISARERYRGTLSKSDAVKKSKAEERLRGVLAAQRNPGKAMAAAVALGAGTGAAGVGAYNGTKALIQALRKAR